ncbi:electron transport complex subunit RsxC [Maribellus sp. YY47]|uniref:electron transport complex subunit RsxC n=1 Tax=Maribellus sp. YY47 TaxID=2929486 RepID=UPI0020008964|nr:electron transport complex subunit RsxC [Maribellus sp. YY47]MCK3683273.1 electron transport complex subunit RsxC [Maribellus sp. YY47]
MLKTFKIGGVHPPENKLSKDRKIEVLSIPSAVFIPVAQHIGAPATPVVKKGDKVKVGQIIAQSSSFVSTNIHSSVSGTVKKIDFSADSSGYPKQGIFIDVESDEWMEDIDRSETLVSEISLDGAEIVRKIQDSGIVGLGGATFPTHVKLVPPKGMKAEVLLINGVECEPYLTSDHRLMLEKADEIMVGIQLLMKAMNVDKAVIGIENNKPDAIELLSEKCKSVAGISVVALKVQYPQGGEKQLINAVTGREVPSGALPIAVGAVVSNVGTAFAVYEAVQKNKPLFERVVTITGKGVSQPSNFLVRIGTATSELVEAAGGLPENTGKIISGGPMMGRAISSLDVPVTKGTSGILLMKQEESKREEIIACIRCSRCVSVCPMGLEPFLLMTLGEKQIFDRAEKEKVMDCIECGSCSYTCPSNRPLLDYIRFGKGKVGQIIRSRKK